MINYTKFLQPRETIDRIYNEVAALSADALQYRYDMGRRYGWNHSPEDSVGALFIRARIGKPYPLDHKFFAEVAP